MSRSKITLEVEIDGDEALKAVCREFEPGTVAEAIIENYDTKAIYQWDLQYAPDATRKKQADNRKQHHKNAEELIKGVLEYGTITPFELINHVLAYMRDEDGRLEPKEIAAICELLGLKFTVEDIEARITKLEAKQ
jgi:hypothetical protein